MNIYQQKYGFVYIWRDRKHKRYYIGSHWGTIDDGYICSSKIMRKAYNRRKDDFKRRIIAYVYSNRKDLLLEEERWLFMIDPNKTMSKNSTSESRKNVRYYNVKLGMQNHWWSDEDSRLTIGEKISKAKKGKSVPCSPEKAKAISEAKKKKFAEKEEALGYKFSSEHRAKMSENFKGRKHTEEWKKQNGERMKQQWSDGTRKRAEPKITMTKEEQAKLNSQGLKNRWADPVWAENQRKRLSEAAKNRPPRSEESKRKAREAQLGKPKNRKSINKS